MKIILITRNQRTNHFFIKGDTKSLCGRRISNPADGEEIESKGLFSWLGRGGGRGGMWNCSSCLHIANWGLRFNKEQKCE